MLGIVLAVALVLLWLSREKLADDYISGQIEQLGLPATYQIESIGTGKQVLTNIVVGDPAHPDLTIERVEAEVGVSGLGRITLVRPRLYGSYIGGKLSFGSLDKVLFTDSKEKFRLPDLDLAIEDGRALMRSDHGQLGVKLAGAGKLRDGFAGTLAAVAPALTYGDCRAAEISLFGKIAVKAERPGFSGPLRLAQLTCPGQRLTMQDAAMTLGLTGDATLDGFDASGDLATGAFGWNGVQAVGSAGNASASWRKGALTAKYDLTTEGVSSGNAGAGTLALEGILRGRDGLSALEAEGQISGADLLVGPELDRALAELERSGEGSLLAPVAKQIRAALAREAAGSALTADYTLRRSGEVLSLTVPSATLRGRNGETLLALSRFNLLSNGTGTPRLSGNIATGGAGLPQIAGRMERRAGGSAVARLRMAEYRAGDARIALPELMLVQGSGGAVGFAGSAAITGALPGGRVEGLVLPLDGNWSARNGLSAWRGCVPLRFEKLAYANLTLERRGLTLCPGPEGAILRSDARGLRIAAGTAALNLAGRLGDTPIRVASGPLGFAYPGTLAAKQLDVVLGAGDGSIKFRIAELSGKLGGDLTGKFTGSDVLLAPVPLDLHEASGNWSYAGGRLAISGAAFRLEDREVDDRFQPLIARDAELLLSDGRITANAVMREPRSDSEVTRVAIRHDLESGLGSADIAVDRLLFDNKLQPDTLTRRALGVIANARGLVTGEGRIDWSPDRVTSTGEFRTDNFDFAAAFGPVKGVSGTVRFADLIGLVTEPRQTLKIASINPGIEVNDGELTFAMQPDSVLQIEGAHWPFLDGTMQLLPLKMTLGVAEVRRYEMRIEGLNAAKFLERMELGNISATGTFDGNMPLVFDEQGGRIEGGLLISRPPGGNVSYVGALTYKDLSPIANFAFDALKSLDYKQMRIAMDGELEGEIVTRVRFDGVKQGQAAKRNFITQRFANLPIRFNVNLRAPFFQLITSFKAMYDPAYVRDPRSLGLVDAQGKPITAAPAASEKSVPIQAPESEKQP